MIHRPIIALALLAPFVSGGEIERLKETIEEQNRQIGILMKRVERLEKDESPREHSHEHEAHVEKGETPLHIALVANMAAVARNVGNGDYAAYAIPGFLDEAGEIPFNPERGFNLNYAEIEFTSSLEGVAHLYSSLHVEKEGLHIGELFVESEPLPGDLTLKGGRFRSAFAEINTLHQHGWNFSSAPLVIETFFSPVGISEDGASLTWRPGATQVGLEALQGTNERSFGAGDAPLYVGYLRHTLRFPSDLAVRVGGSWMHGKNPVGTTDIYGGELKVTKTFGAERSLTWQTLLLERDRAGERQGGLYTEALYMADAEVGGALRYDLLYKNLPGEPEDLDRWTAALIYKPYDFAKVRLQYTYDRSKRFGTERRDVHELLLGLTIEAGEHAEHVGHNH
ncbi:hypothetical protein [Hydrogenimonas sp.]